MLQQPPKTPKQAVLIVANGDYLEAFADKSIDVHIARVPSALTPRGERIAEACLEKSLPLRYRDLWRRDLLRANALVRPLTAEMALAALVTKDCIAALSEFLKPMERHA